MANEIIQAKRPPTDEELRSFGQSNVVMAKRPPTEEEIKLFGQPNKRPDLIDTMAGISPEELAKQGHWIGSGIQQTGKDILATPAHFFNQMLMNYPRTLTHQAGYEYPENTQSKTAGVLAKTAGVVGGFKNPLLKILKAGEPLAQAALKAGALGATYAPEKPFSQESIPQRLTSGVISAAIPLAGEGIRKSIPTIQSGLKDTAGRVVNSLIKPLLKDFSYGKNPGFAVAQEGITASNLEDLANKISIARQNKGQEIFSILTKPEYQKIRLNISNEIKPIDEAMIIAAKQNNQTLINRLQEVKKAVTQNLTLSEELGQPVVKTSGDKNLSNLTPLEATKIKTEIGDLTKWTGNPTDDKLVNKALKQVYGGIKEKIGNAVPEVKSLNERYANLTSAEIATQYRDKITQRQNIISIAPKMAGYGGVLAGLATGNPALIMESIGVLGADKILGSTALKTRLASGLNKLGEADLNKITNVYPKLISVIKKVQNL